MYFRIKPADAGNTLPLVHLNPLLLRIKPADAGNTLGGPDLRPSIKRIKPADAGNTTYLHKAAEFKAGNQTRGCG